MTENYLLEVKNVSKSFGVVKALNRIDFNVRPNEIHALCGENGAGKSTLMNILSGVYPYGSYGGEVYYDGELCKFRNVRESEKKNIAIIHQHLALFPALSIAENIFLGNENAKNSVIDWKLTIRRAAELMERVGLHENPETKIRDLGVGNDDAVYRVGALSDRQRQASFRKTHDCLDKSSGHGARGALLGADCLAAAGGIYALSVLRDGCAAAAENGKQGLTNRLAGTVNCNFNWNGLGASLRGSLLF